MGVVVIDVLGDDRFELPPVEDQHPVEALAADRADESLSEGVGPWGSDRRADDPDPLRSQDLVEAGGDLAPLSLTRNRTGRARLASTIVRLRACWTCGCRNVIHRA